MLALVSFNNYLVKRNHGRLNAFAFMDNSPNGVLVACARDQRSVLLYGWWLPQMLL